MRRLSWTIQVGSKSNHKRRCKKQAGRFECRKAEGYVKMKEVKGEKIV